MVADSSAAQVSDGVSKRSRSAVTNGRRLFVDSIGDTASSRRHRDVLDALIAQYDATSESDMQLARRAAALAFHLEQEEARVVCGAAVDVGAMVTKGNHLRRLLRDLGASLKARRRAQRGAA